MAAGDLTNLSAVKRWLNISSDNDDALLTDLVTQVSSFVENTIQRKVLTTTHVETYRGTGGSRFLLRNWPVQSVTSVEWGETRIDTVVDAIGNASGVATDGRSVILVGSRTPYDRPVRVTYVAGYDSVPADLMLAVTELVGEAYSARTHIGQTSHASSGTTTVAFSREAMHQAVLARLNNYMLAAPL